MPRTSLLLALLLPLAGCTTPSTPPKPAPPPAAPLPVAPAPPDDWRDRAEAPGGWTYVGDVATPRAWFGLPGAPVFVMRCDRASRRVSLIRSGTSGATMRVETSYSPMSWPTRIASDGATVTLEARDAFLDKIAFSRGRFTVALDGQTELVLPAWAEPARVIEDCRTPQPIAAPAG